MPYYVKWSYFWPHAIFYIFLYRENWWISLLQLRCWNTGKFSLTASWSLSHLEVRCNVSHRSLYDPSSFRLSCEYGIYTFINGFYNHCFLLVYSFTDKVEHLPVKPTCPRQGQALISTEFIAKVQTGISPEKGNAYNPSPTQEGEEQGS